MQRKFFQFCSHVIENQEYSFFTALKKTKNDKPSYK